MVLADIDDLEAKVSADSPCSGSTLVRLTQSQSINALPESPNHTRQALQLPTKNGGMGQAATRLCRKRKNPSRQSHDEMSIKRPRTVSAREEATSTYHR